MPPEKRKRRTAGAGTIVEKTMPNGTVRYIGRIEVGYTRSGNRRRVEVSGKTRSEVAAKIRQKLTETRDPLASAPMTVKRWAESWITEQQTRLRPKTWSSYAGHVNLWIVPTIGQRRLDRLTPADVRAVAKAMTDAGRSQTSALHVHVTLGKMLRDATLDGQPVPPRVLLTESPGKGDDDKDAIPTDDALSLLSIARNQPGGSRWFAALVQGLRQGEALGLTWDRVDFDRAVLDVSMQLQPIPYMHGCGDKPCGRRFGGDCPKRRFRIPNGLAVRHLEGAYCLVPPKTTRGRRIIPLTPWMATALRDWRGQVDSPHGLVWPRLDGRPQTARADTESWVRLQDAAGVSKLGDHWSLHEARHTCATLLLEAGVDPEVIKAIMGHSSIVTTRGYQHVSQAMARQALELVSGRLQLD